VTNPLSVPLVLASTSPRRRELLLQAGFDFTPISPGASGVDETPLVHEPPAEYVMRLAQAKSRAGQDSLLKAGLSPSSLVLGADTTVSVDDLILEKPSDAADAKRMLSLLSGRIHHVYTALCLRLEQREETLLSVSRVHFDHLTEQDISDYIASGEPFDKAGAYGIQGRGAKFIKHLEGSYSGVMGLPLYEFHQLFQRFQHTGSKEE